MNGNVTLSDAPTGRALSTVIAIALGLTILNAPAAQPNTVFSTAFEAAEGYDAGFEISGQNGWLSEGSGGNGLLNERFTGSGAQAYVGFHPPLVQNEQSFSLWRPLNYDAVADGRPIVVFTVAMEVADSTNDKRDDFRWSAYNSAGHRLFTLSFNNATTEICYALDDLQGFQPTPYVFERGAIYDLEITMDFAANLWTARLGTAVLLEDKPITTTEAALDLGDLGPVWYYLDPAAPGDNFMAFDDYAIVSSPPADPTPTLEVVSGFPDGRALIRLLGLSNRTYAIEASENLVIWTQLKTGASANGVIDHLDDEASGMNLRFYRGRVLD